MIRPLLLCFSIGLDCRAPRSFMDIELVCLSGAASISSEASMMFMVARRKYPRGNTLKEDKQEIVKRDRSLFSKVKMIVRFN